MPDLTWHDVEDLTTALAGRIRAADARINHVIAISRGGFVPARLLSTALGIKRLGSVGVTYEDPARTVPVLWAPPGGLRESDRVLLVEDAIESGRSAIHAADLIRPQVEVLFTAAFFHRPNSIAHLDFTVELCDQIPRFPWE